MYRATHGSGVSVREVSETLPEVQEDFRSREILDHTEFRLLRNELLHTPSYYRFRLYSLTSITFGWSTLITLVRVRVDETLVLPTLPGRLTV